MNNVIEFLNGAGEGFWKFAWPMLWQSSLLIFAIYFIERICRRRMRASVRYALWLIVLVKLVLPPSLALPTGLSWWVRPPVAATTQPLARTYTVVYGPESAGPALATAANTGALVPHWPELRVEARFLIVGFVVGLALFGWMLIRWRQIAIEIRRADAAPAQLTGLLDDLKRQAGVWQRVEIKILARQISPAVCGLFRPVILLPASLLHRLPSERLRPVLLHELFHLKRGDVWLNCVQTLLQMVYWWHPLVWLANARIRRVREEAVDDAVMLALRDKAETYAPTLLEVAKLALERPLATLGLVGILESHQALRPRIERLLELRPRKPGRLSFAASLCLFAFGAIALPMGQAPARLSDKSGIARQTATSNPLAGTENNFDATNRIPVLSDVPIVGWLFRTNRNDALARMHESGSLDNSGPSAAILPKPGLSPETLSRIEGLRIETKSELVRLRALTEYLRQLPPDKLPLAIPTAELKETILPSLMDRLSSAEQNLVGLKKDFGPAHPEVLKATSQIEDLNTKIQTRTFGIMLGLKLKADAMEKSLEALDQEVTAAIQKDVERANGASNAQFTTGRFFFVDGEVKQPGQKVYLVNSTQDLELLRKALEELGDLRTKYTDSHPLVQSKLAVVTNLQARLNRSNNAVRRGSSNPTFGEDAESKVVPPSKLETRVIKLDPATLSQLIKNVGPVYQQSTVAAIQEYLRTVGVELGPTERIWYKEKEGTLIVTASASKMGVIEKALQGINISAAQVHIKARFVEVPSAWPDIMPPPSRPILTAGEARAFLKTLTTASNVLDEVSITTLTGRAAEIQIIPDAPAAQSSHPLATQLSRQGLAPVATTKTLDVTPTLTDDGWQLELKAAATVAEFIGFDGPGTLFTAPGQTPVPRYRHRELTASQERTRLWDGDSLVLQESMETSDTRHFVVLTATLIDPAGNRLHTDEEVERARSGK